MKNLYSRLTKAPVDAPVTYSHGISPNCSPYTDTPTGYTVLNNQNSKKWRMLPLLATTLMLLLLSFSGKAQTISFNQTQPSCFNSNDGGLRAIASGTCATGYQYLWTPGNFTTDTISNLAPGTYSVRVVCGTDTVNQSVTLTASTVIAAPTTAGNIVVFTGTKNISQLDVTPLAGGTLNYYYEATGGTALPGSTMVVDDTTYYVTQTVAGCESNPRKAIKVNRIANDSIVLCNSDSVASLTATPLTGNTIKWFEVPTGGSALANNTALATGVDTLYVEEGNSNNKNV